MSNQLSADLASLRIDRDAPTGRPSPGRRVALILTAVVAVGALSLVGWRRFEGTVFQQEMRLTEVAMVSPAQADVLVTATGYVVPQRTSKVGSKIPGRLEKVFVKEGDSVKEGDVIAQLEDADQKTQVAAASSRVGAAQARVATARANLAEISLQVEREKKLVASGAVGRASLDDLLARESSLREAVSAAQADADAARTDVGTLDVGLKDRSIVSPISGRVVTKPATVGEFVGGVGSPTSIAEIVDFTSMLVEADVPEARLHMVKLGGACEIVLDAYPNRSFKGIAVELGQRVNRSKATVMVKVKFAEGEDLASVLPEMSARVSFLSKPISDEAKSAGPKKVVPKAAVVERGGRPVVFTVDAGKLHATDVKTGAPVGDTAVELLDGPPAGAKIVASPTAETQDGQRIKDGDK